ncbi:MAG: hypothetical protein HQK53_14210 [Oligoflexia bacterium]|nr:hypothetical protein [Oligoflexia bacterium]
MFNFNPNPNLNRHMPLIILVITIVPIVSFGAAQGDGLQHRARRNSELTASLMQYKHPIVSSSTPCTPATTPRETPEQNDLAFPPELVLTSISSTDAVADGDNLSDPRLTEATPSEVAIKIYRNFLTQERLRLWMEAYHSPTPTPTPTSTPNSTPTNLLNRLNDDNQEEVQMASSRITMAAVTTNESVSVEPRAALTIEDLSEDPSIQQLRLFLPQPVTSSIEVSRSVSNTSRSSCLLQ